MGDEYEDLVELGFEGVDKFATRFHDPVTKFVGHHANAHAPKWLGGKKQGKYRESPPDPEPQEKGRARELPPGDSIENRDIPQPPSPDPPRGHPNDPLSPPGEHLNDNGTYPQRPPPGRQPPPPQYLPYIPLPQPEQYLPKIPPPPIGAQLQHQQYPPAPHSSQAGNPPRRRARFEEDSRRTHSAHSDSEADFDRRDRKDRGDRSMYAENRRRERHWRDDGGCNNGTNDVYERDVGEQAYYGYTPDGRRVEVTRSVRRKDDWRDGGQDDVYTKKVEERAYHSPATDRGALVVRRDVPGGGAVVPRAPEPPQYGYSETAWAVGGRPRPNRRPSSWSPPRARRSAERGRESPSRGPRSKSPNHHRAVAMIVGALAGGLAGSRLKKGEAGPNTVATVAGAVVGGLGARELEQVYDRRKHRRRLGEQEEEEREERRARRRWERDQGY